MSDSGEIQGPHVSSKPSSYMYSPHWKFIVGIAAGATACVAAVPVVTTALGFTASGVTAGSTAAGESFITFVDSFLILSSAV